MNVKLLLKPCNEQFLPIRNPTTISVDSIKSQLQTPKRKYKEAIDLNSEFTLDYTFPFCLSPRSFSLSSHFSLSKSQSQQQTDKIIKIIDIKFFISSQINVKPEGISLFMFNPSTGTKFQLLHDYEEFMTYNPIDQKSQSHKMRKYSESTSDDNKQKVLYFKISKDKQKILVDIFQNNIDKLILNISHNCSIYMLKHIINMKLNCNIPLEYFTIYGVGYVDNNTFARSNQPLNKALSNRIFTDEVLIEEVVKYYYIEEDNLHQEKERNLNKEDRANSILNIILIKKTKDKCIMGLDFRFNHMRNYLKLAFKHDAPSYRETSDGLNLFFYCKNPHCRIFNDYYIVMKGYGHFDILEEIMYIKCPKCYGNKKDLRNIGFVNSKWKYKGLLKNKKDAKIDGDGFTLDNMLYVFQEILFVSQFHYLLIENEVYLANSIIDANNDIDSSSMDNDSSSDLNDISLCYPKEGRFSNSVKNKDKDIDEETDGLKLLMKQRDNNNNNVINSNDTKGINEYSKLVDIIIEGKDKTNCYKCFVFNDSSLTNDKNKSCSCMIF